MTGTIAARRYANALFALSGKLSSQEREQNGSGLAQLAQAMDEVPALAKLFGNPAFTLEEKQAVLDKILAELGVTGTLRRFCKLLVDKGRFTLLQDISKCYAAALDIANGIIRGNLVTAIPLTEERRASILAALGQSTGKKLVLDFEQDASILGGIVLHVGDTVLDASLRAQLHDLGETIKRGE